MRDGWQPQATIAIACIALLPLWVAVCFTLIKSGKAEGWGIAMFVSSCLIVVVGIACAISGVRRGSRASRTASVACLAVLSLLIVGVTVFLVSLSRSRFA